MQPLAGVDAALSRAVEAKEVPCVVALPATDPGILYEGAFGLRDVVDGPAMTRDSVFRIASMTKAVTSVAAMQLVEQGKLQLDEPIGNVLHELAAPQVLEGFDSSGAPRLRPAKRPITLRHLLTHTAGFGYETWDPDLIRYVKVSGTPSTSTGKLASLRLPLVFDRGDRWDFVINIDWAGRGRSSKRPAARGLLSRAYLCSAWDEGHRLRDFFRPTIASRHCASTQAGRVAGTHTGAGSAVARILERRRRSLFDRTRLPGIPANAAQSGSLRWRPAVAAGNRRTDGAQSD